MKIHPVGAEFHADRQTDMTKLIISCCNSAKAPKNQQDIKTYLLFTTLTAPLQL